jgi:cystathionine gamma-synthase
MNSPHDLCVAPRWRPEDLGAPLPDLPHANSVCLPTWRDVIDYEEKAPRVIERLRAGYPRFVIPPSCARLFALAREEICTAGEDIHLYRSPRAAGRCAAHIEVWSGATARVVEWRGVHAVCFPASAAVWALKYWRHTGEGISSRQAQAILDGAGEPDGAPAAALLRERIAAAVGVRAEDVYLFSCGMSAIYTLYRCLRRLRSNSRIAQFGFPYVDTLKIVQDFGAPHIFFPHADACDVLRLDAESARDHIGGLFCEFPSNPMLASADLEALRQISLRDRFPIIIDDTISTWTNVNLLPAADAIATSLTKWFTGRGDVMLGSAIINPESPFADELRALLALEYEHDPWGEACILAEQLSRDADARVRRASETARRVAEWLSSHPAVDSVHYPLFQHRELYDKYRRADGGYGGLLSFTLKNPETSSEVFYNALEVCKGPNLGTTFTLCCPFTLLAHYDELSWAESCGVSRWLLRLSIGQESAEDLIDRLSHALYAIEK